MLRGRARLRVQLGGDPAMKATIDLANVAHKVASTRMSECAALGTVMALACGMSARSLPRFSYGVVVSFSGHAINVGIGACPVSARFCTINASSQWLDNDQYCYVLPSARTVALASERTFGMAKSAENRLHSCHWKVSHCRHESIQHSRMEVDGSINLVPTHTPTNKLIQRTSAQSLCKHCVILAYIVS